MPADSPQVGEIWVLPSQPTLTTSGEGGEALVVGITPGVITLYSRRGRRLLLPERSLQLMWQFVRDIGEPAQCSTSPCLNPAWFEYSGTDRRDVVNEARNIPVCWAHIPPDTTVDFLELGTSNQGRCPACGAGAQNNGGGSSEVDGFRVNSCGHCRRDWCWFRPSESSPEACVLLAEQVSRVAEVMEERGLVARIRVGAHAFDMIRRAVGALGEPPHLHGIQIARLPALDAPTSTAYVVGYQPRDIPRGVQRLGGQPDQGPDLGAPVAVKPFTNASPPGPIRVPPEALVVGASWWNKTTYEAAFIVEVGVKMHTAEVCIKFRDSGFPEVMTLDAFLEKYTDKPPSAPCKVGEEWVDSRDKVIKIKTLEETAARIEDSTGRTYLLPYAQLHQWRRIDRKSVYERLMDDDDDPV